MQVPRELRGQGEARALLGFYMMKMKEYGVQKVIATVGVIDDVRQSTLLEIYKKLGFQVQESEDPRDPDELPRIFKEIA